MPRQLRRLTTERSATIILFLLLLAMAARIHPDSDMWWHLRAGQRILERGQLIDGDSFSHTFAGVRWQNQSAVADLAMALIWARWGMAGMILFTAIMAVAGMALVYGRCDGSAYARAFLLVFGAIAASLFWSPRPQMFTFVFAAATLWLLDQGRNGSGYAAWLIAPLMWLWCNVHGGWILGYMLIAAVCLGDCLKAWGRSSPVALRRGPAIAFATAASIPLLALNPLGAGVYAAPLATIGMPQLRAYIQEWQPPDFSQPGTIVFALLLILTLALLLHERERDYGDWLLLSLGAGMALIAGRNISLFVVIALPIAGRRIDAMLIRRGWSLRIRELETPRRLLLNLVLIALVAVGLCLRLRYVTSPEAMADQTRRVMPVAAVERLKWTAAEGALFNSYNWGGYLIFHAPKFPVFIDGRSDLYRDFLDEYHHIAIGGEGWQGALDEHGVAIALIESRGGLAKAMAGADEWMLVYQDALASIFQRTKGGRL